MRAGFVLSRKLGSSFSSPGWCFQSASALSGSRGTKAGRKNPAVSRRRSLAEMVRCRLVMTAHGRRAADTPPWCEADLCCVAMSALSLALAGSKWRTGAEVRLRCGADLHLWCG